MELFKDKYEISLWEDILTTDSDGVEYYDEIKLCTIGSNTMEEQFRALSPKLVENVNGSNTFTFKIFYTYIDNETGERKSNPFLRLLVNERKVKVLWKNKWYDLIIKASQESSDGKSITYTCKDLFVNELSKTGFNLEFDNELQNNSGTVTELAAQILDGTDWAVESTLSDKLVQTVDEPLYKVQLKNLITAKKIDAAAGTTTDVQIATNQFIYVFYSCVANQTTEIQFLYEADESNYKTDDNSQLLVDTTAYKLNVYWVETEGIREAFLTNGSAAFTVAANQGVSDQYRGSRYVESQKTIFEPLLDRYVGIYTNSSGKTYYGYETTEYKDPTVVFNLVSNAKDFAGTESWVDVAQWKIYPEYSISGKSYLLFNKAVFNNGIKNSLSYIPNGFTIGEKYVFRIKGYNSLGGTLTAPQSVRICDYNAGAVANSDYFTVGAATQSNGWIEYKLTCKKSITRNEISSSRIMICITPTSNLWVEEVQFFQLVENDNGYIVPGEMDANSVVQTVYRYYEPNQGVISVDDLKYAYSDTAEWAAVSAVGNGYEKIRSITGKNSNRFNLIQELAETFECWALFNIDHDLTGRIIPGTKTITFKEKIGEEVGFGFIYGIDLKTISRTINSDQIASKVIVSPNINEYAENGICEIAQSKDNYPRENFILNFDYYINQGLISGAQVNKDLYDNQTGYYFNLNKKNVEYFNKTEELVAKKTELDRYEALEKIRLETISAANETLTSAKTRLAQLAGLEPYNKYEAQIQAYVANNPKNLTATDYATQISNSKNQITSAEAELKAIQDKLGNWTDKNSNSLRPQIVLLEDRLEEILEEIEEIHADFYKKYSRFIQEGSWISQDHLDNTLYYYDALAVAYESSRPQTSYNISVLRLSALPEFKNKIFKVGDISYIEDTEFFGYKTVNGAATNVPYHEQVLISEVTSNFDSPELDTFKVQNYKTQFEDLFQRITASTQSLQYSSGEYQMAANIVETNGTINGETLQSSLNINQNLVISSTNESVVSDNTGITVKDIDDPSKISKLTSGGLLISRDGGLTWQSAIRSDGINADYLTSGLINTDRIAIMNGSVRTFRWDSNGINAYTQRNIIDPETGESVITGVDPTNFVRFDQYGIYGYKGEENFVPEDETEIKEEALFGLLWSGFFMKNKYGNGYISISNVDDIVVSDGINQRVKIGNLGTADVPIYGIRLKDAAGATSLETDDQGKLWLKDKLSIGTVTNPTNGVQLGKLGPLSGNFKNEVFNANNKFIVFEDGAVKAADGEFSGTIYATGGKIGNLSIGQIEELGIVVEIMAENGDTFTVTKDGSATALQLKANIKEISNPTYAWQVSSDGANYSATKSVTSSYTLQYDKSLFTSDVMYVKLTVNNTYTDVIVIKRILQGVDSNIYRIEPNQTSIFKTKTKTGQEIFDDSYIIEFSPKILQIYAYNTSNFSNEQLTNFDLNLEYLSASGWTSLNFLNTAYSAFSAGDEDYLFTNKTSSGATLDYWNFNIAQIHKTDWAPTSSTNATILANLKSAIEMDASVNFRLSLKIDEEIVATLIFSLNWGTSNEMLDFSITGAKISAIIRESKLEFTENGLEVIDGGFKIKTNIGTSAAPVYKDLLYFNDGDLHITGIIEATGGSFTGNISAQSGYIGGFTISKDTLVSSDSSIILDGINNKITVTDIDIGRGANIVEYIQLGNARLQNPNMYNRVFITAADGAIRLTDNGVLTLGKLNFNGVSSIISGTNWTIEPEVATFRNIIAQGGEIQNVVFSNASTQAAGGAMLFRPSYKVNLTSSGYEVEEMDGQINTNSIVQLIGEDNSTARAKIKSVSNNIVTFTILNNNTQPANITSMIYLGTDGEVVQDSLMIGANGASQDIVPFNLKKNSITFTTLNKDGDYYDYTSPLLVLGDLTGVNKVGYGLYSNNVYLTGTLTTQIDTSGEYQYAGVNTIDGVVNDDNERIVFWAGSYDDTEEAIRNAPFIVTEKGNLFASKGTFKGSILTDAEIQGAIIRTAHIYGWENGAEAALNFYNTSNGIVFKKGDLSSNVEVFRISQDGLRLNAQSSYFIDLTDGVIFTGNQFIGKYFVNDDLLISENRIGYKNDTDGLSQTHYLQFDPNSALFKNGNIFNFEINNNKSIAYQSFNAKKDFILGEEDGLNMKYEKVDGGYDLYVYEGVVS